jgi:hypothetical protein
LRESIRIGLCPDRVIFARYGRGLRPRLLARGILSAEAVPAQEPWRAPLAALPKLLQLHSPRAADAVVVLSNHFVRYLVLEANDRLSSREEWREYASHRLEKTYGARARDWHVRIAEAGPAHPRVASAIDKTLLEAAAAAFKGSRARLWSIEPYLMTAFNQALPALRQSSFWFVVEEPGRLLLGLVRDGLWQSVRGRQANTRGCEELPQAVERESALLASREPCRDVVVSPLRTVQLEATNGFKFTTPPSPLAGEDGAYAMVCA